MEKKVSANSRKPGMENFSHDIESYYYELFQTMAGRLRGKKYEILQGAIDAFSALPFDIQARLVSTTPEIRDPALAALSNLSMPKQSNAKLVADPKQTYDSDADVDPDQLEQEIDDATERLEGEGGRGKGEE